MRMASNHKDRRNVFLSSKQCPNLGIFPRAHYYALNQHQEFFLNSPLQQRKMSFYISDENGFQPQRSTERFPFEQAVPKLRYFSESPLLCLESAPGIFSQLPSTAAQNEFLY